MTIRLSAARARAMGVAVPRKPKSKYGNRKVELPDGTKFDSRREARRWQVLVVLRHAGELKDLQRQVPFDIEINGHLICRYIADFVYQRDGRLVVEDAKGMRTDVYKLKKKLLRAVHGIEIEEV